MENTMNRYLVLFALAFSLSVHAETDQHASDHGGASLQIPDDIRELLRQEMLEIRKGMEALVFAVAAGEWDDIARIGSDIKHSYILKKKLTEEQKHRLHSDLPDRFVELDGKFHHYAGMLSHVAEERDIGLVQYYVYKMNEACTSCHAKFAAGRFTGFTLPNKHMQHMHHH